MLFRSGLLPINPGADFTIQLHAMVLGLALLPDTFDSDIIDSTRIWLDGEPGVITNRVLVTHTDPASGLTWVAVSYDDSGEETGVAARMIGRANLLDGMLLSAGEDDPRIEEELGLLRENLNLLRAIHQELGVLAY